MAEEKKFTHDPEEPEFDKATYRLPFALCKAKGIQIQDWWTPRDAWNTLKRGGAVSDVSEEYAEFFRRKKKERQKEVAKIKKEHKDLVKKQEDMEEHNPLAGYTHQKGSIAGVRKGNPMTFEEADSGRVNPFFGDNVVGYKTNCQTCVATYVARRLGYDVRALPNLNNKNIYKLSHNTALAFVDKNGQEPIKRAVGGKTGIHRHTEPDRLYSLEFAWKGERTGHIVICEKVDNEVKLYDPQTNIIYTGIEKDRLLGKAKNFKLTDLTDCTMNEQFCDSIMRGVKK